MTRAPRTLSLPKGDLWCLHVHGPDDVHAAPTKEAAIDAARRFTAYYRHRPLLLEISFKAAPWPHTPESHAEDVKLWDEKMRGL